MGLQLLTFWDCGFESHEVLEWLSLSCECCLLPGGGLCDGLIITQKRPTECGVSNCDSEA